jgi:hypothetical protein
VTEEPCAATGSALAIIDAVEIGAGLLVAVDAAPTRPVTGEVGNIAPAPDTGLAVASTRLMAGTEAAGIPVGIATSVAGAAWGPVGAETD